MTALAPGQQPTAPGESPPPGRLAVEAEGLAAGFGRRVVWSEAGFSIPSGTFTAVLGPNGAGKSTLLRVLLGLAAPLAGHLEILGRRPRRGNPAIGYVPQGRSFDAELSIRGRDYVALGVDGHRWGPPRPFAGAAARAAVAAAVDAVGAGTYADRQLGRLSGGEQQRLVLAQALVGEPRLLLLDEPLSNLDVRNQAAIIQLVAEVARRRGLTVILVAHDVNPLLTYVDRILYVAQGRIAVGTPREIITSEALSRIYGAPVEVVRDSRGRLFVVGLEEEAHHPHGD
ncbi:MAG: ATP-binding cassette domain-containing protein [Candidatus Dormibacteraeota bacterium]|nr:ATP-binding cassette domain-containing protein [Candidatus Dormibacteraeota bacterium]